MPSLTQSSASATPPAGSSPRWLDRLPPESFFLVSAVFHYLGPSLAVLLFTRIDVLGVAWLRIATAAAVFALWRRPWRLVSKMQRHELAVLVRLGVVLAAMNSVFYLAVDRLPLSTVGAIEFLGTVVLAAVGVMTRRNAVAVALTVGGVAIITDIRLAGSPLGFAFAFANCALFMLYVVLGHRIATSATGPGARPRRRPRRRRRRGRRLPAPSGVDQLGASMLVAAVVVSPVGLADALTAFTRPELLLAAVGVGVCSSVVPYVTDQLAMARMPRATFALMLALLPVFATIVGAIVLRQIPTPRDLLGIALVVAGVALHQSPTRPRGPNPGPAPHSPAETDAPRSPNPERRGPATADHPSDMPTKGFVAIAPQRQGDESIWRQCDWALRA
jgi:inner membrane transporter RhtA